MHGGVGLCSCRHLVDEVCEGPVVPVTLVVHIAEFEVPAPSRRTYLIVGQYSQYSLSLAPTSPSTCKTKTDKNKTL